MKPDLENKWMEAELGSFDEHLTSPPPPVKKASRAVNIGQLVYAAARIVLALLFALHGAQKLVGLFGGGAVQHDSWQLGTGILEFLGGVVIALGLYTRPVALALFTEMAWVYYQLSIPGPLWPVPNHGEFPALYGAFFLFLAAFGPGSISIERMRGKA